MFDELIKSRMEKQNKIKYLRELGWKEFDEEENETDVLIFVLDIDYGFAVFRQGNETNLLHYSRNIHEAIEWAVDEARKQIAAHEIRESKKQ